MKRRVNVVFHQLYVGLVIIFFISVQIAFRSLVSLSTIAMLVVALLYYRLNSGKWWNRSFWNHFTMGCFLYFAIQAIALLYTRNRPSGLFIIQTDLGLIALPIAVFYSCLVSRENWGRLMTWYTAALLFTTAIAMGYAVYLFLQTGNTGVFFYHPLVSIYSDHAIQFSVLVFIGILFLIEEYSRLTFVKSRNWIRFLLIYFSVFLFLLTSKLIISIYFIYIIYLVVFTEKFSVNRSYRLIGLTIILAILVLFIFTNSPLRRRMTEDLGSNFSILKQDKFSPHEYFNGVQFRLISWRFVYEILNENHRWLLGVSPGDAQDMLDNKYRQLNMFTGGSPGNKNGYLVYHTHNQFLQALLETGIPGLLAFILICAGMIQLAVKSGNRSMIVLTVLLLCYCFSDAVLKTQYGIIIFVFFPLFLYKGQENPESPHQSS
jgi:O-antigen ligase